YGEFDNSGAGFTPEERVSWSHQLTPKEAEQYTLESIFDGWNPLERLGK
ncbi:MAG TPA: pectin esterase, partial [Balneolaceae bacterium]|nr:pectin esterase [Balneolaceae bacterium]